MPFLTLMQLGKHLKQLGMSYYSLVSLALLKRFLNECDKDSLIYYFDYEVY